jgi:hypothetical protein
MLPEQYGVLPVLEPFGSPDILPESVDLANELPPPGNQGSQPSCVGWAVAYGLKSYHERVERGWSLSEQAHLMSPAFVYNQIKVPAGGAYIHEALELVAGQGVSSLATMPYDSADNSTYPSQQSFTEAAAYRIERWARINQGSVQEMKKYLAGNTPIVVGMKVYPDFDSLNSSNPIYNTDSGQLRGYHAVLLIGYDDSKGAFKIFNSWGTRWGIDGYGWLAYALVPSVIVQGYITIDIVAGILPENATSPSPSNGADSLSISTTLSWVNGGGTDSYKVYFGTNPSPGSGEYKTTTTSTNYTLPSLDYGTSYYWRIDAVNAYGTTTGTVWHFTTENDSSPPSQATSPIPSNGATDQTITTNLGWVNGGGTDSYKVYFGTNPSPGSGEYKTTTTSTNYTLPSLDYGTSYYWRIDAVNAYGTTTGTVWHFTTENDSSPPSQATSPIPSNGATDQTITINLGWVNGGGTDSYKVYFGTNPSPGSGEYKTTITSTNYTLPSLDYGTSYYWRIDAVNAYGTTTGTVWHFATVLAPDFIFSRTSGLITTESGGSASFTVVLQSQPTASVTLPLSSSDTTEGIINLASITFTTSNWNVPQTVVVTGVNDFAIDGDQSYQVVTGAASSMDLRYNGFNPLNILVTNSDNDSTGISTILTTKDCTTSSATPDYNKNTENLSILYQTDPYDLISHVSLVYFSLSSIPNGASIESAVLKLYCYSRSGTPQLVVSRLHSSPNWSETGVTFSNMPYATTPPSAAYYSISDGWNNYNTTELIKAWVESGYYNAGLQLAAGTENQYAIFYNREYSTTYVPRLQVEWKHLQ